MRIPRRVALPDAVRRSLDLARGERVLAADALPGDAGWAVASDHALHLPVAGGGWDVVPWHVVLRARWDADAAVLHVEEGATAERAGRWHRVVLDPQRPALLEAVRERVTSSIVATRAVRVSTGGTVRVVARRVPLSTELEWQLVPDPGVDLDDPLTRAEAERALEEMRTSILL